MASRAHDTRPIPSTAPKSRRSRVWTRSQPRRGGRERGCPVWRGAVTRHKRGSASTRWGCSRTGPPRCGNTWEPQNEIETIVMVAGDSRHSLPLSGSPPSGTLLTSLSRRDVRVVEGARLESVCRGNSTVGSNPTLSANLACGEIGASSRVQARCHFLHPSQKRGVIRRFLRPKSTE